MTFARIARALLVGAFAALVTAVLLPYRADLNWTFELPAHFMPWTSSVFIAMGSLFLVMRPRVIGVLALVFGLWHAAPLVELYWPQATPIREGGVTVYMHNVNHVRGPIDPAIEAAFTADDDLVCFLEIPIHDSLVVAARMNERYPYFASNGGIETYSIALWSRYPIDASETYSLSPRWPLPALLVHLGADGESLTFFMAHSQPPIDSKRCAVREEEWAALGRTWPLLTEPFAVMGDFNTTTGLARFRDLVSAAGLHDSRRGFGMMNSWRRMPGFPEFAIDHIYVSRGMTVLDRSVGDFAGSDHRAVRARLTRS